MVEFHKYQGTGNDFVMIDGRSNKVKDPSQERIREMCLRRFGIGADGLILIREHSSYDFEMVYYNSDGTQSFCGNGSRCAVTFARKLGIIDRKAEFMAIDGVHEAQVLDDERVCLKMGDHPEIREEPEVDRFIDTGSPHVIQEVDDLIHCDVSTAGKTIRESETFEGFGGTNVNFVRRKSQNEAEMRTYERGVEKETLSCGTGVVAAAIHLALKAPEDEHFFINTRGGELEVTLERESGNSFKNIWLTGPAEYVYSGQYPG